MIYYQISGFEWQDGYESYLPDEEGFTYFFYLSFTKEQPIKRLKLIFIDLINAEYDKIGHSNCNPNKIEIRNIVKSNSPIENVNIN
tara:strand:+ start:40 stop:297 length:258 start_codon:yes stop_codon:yes gene_type:complete